MNAQQVWQAQATEAPRISLGVRASPREQRSSARTRLAQFAGTYVVCVLACGYWGWIRRVAVLRRTSPLMLAALVCLRALGRSTTCIAAHRYAAAEASAGRCGRTRHPALPAAAARAPARLCGAAAGAGGCRPILAGHGADAGVDVSSSTNPVPWKWIGIMTAGVCRRYRPSPSGHWNTEARRFQREIDALDSL